MDEKKNVLLNGEPMDPKNDKIASSEDDKKQKFQKEPEEEKMQYSTRSNIIWLLCGAYLVYTGYNLLSGFIQKAEGSGIGFAIVGGVFILLGGTFAFFGGKRWLDADKKKREEENSENESEDTETSALKRVWKASEQAAQEQQGRKISIAERARLGSEESEEIDETEESENSEEENESSDDISES